MEHPVLNVYAYKMDNAIIICSHENKKVGGWKKITFTSLTRQRISNNNANAFM